MKRNRIDQEFYDGLVSAFRDAPGNTSSASRAVSCDRRTARKAWNEGWPDLGFLPVKQVVEEEQAETRARLKVVRSEDLARQELENEKLGAVRDSDARDDAIAARTEEARTVRAARHNAMGLLAVTQRLLRGANRLAEKIEQDIATADLRPAQAISLFQTIASTARASNETAKLAIAMERNLLGEPEKIIGHHHTMTEAQAVREIELAGKAAERARARGVVIDVPSEAVVTG